MRNTFCSGPFAHAAVCLALVRSVRPSSIPWTLYKGCHCIDPSHKPLGSVHCYCLFFGTVVDHSPNWQSLRGHSNNGRRTTYAKRIGNKTHDCTREGHLRHTVSSDSWLQTHVLLNPPPFTITVNVCKRTRVIGCRQANKISKCRAEDKQLKNKSPERKTNERCLSKRIPTGDCLTFQIRYIFMYALCNF